jgi:hypothetical protein
MNILITMIVFWIICGIIAYGASFAYFQALITTDSDRLRPHMTKKDREHALYMGVLGPIGLFAIYDTISKYSLQYRSTKTISENEKRRFPTRLHY